MGSRAKCGELVKCNKVNSVYYKDQFHNGILYFLIKLGIISFYCIFMQCIVFYTPNPFISSYCIRGIKFSQSLLSAKILRVKFRVSLQTLIGWATGNPAKCTDERIVELKESKAKNKYHQK